ncbi:unnamed protein product [Protopolystoma xenopodis]|uniref:Uncharacterized protein n=1 Tax=Protopolystoma xenopodis TaxID=117903 RepID=A0A3S5ABM3_9PLAT|nr:unnamed protein product [Protopolystoma xenopodis]
MNAFDTDSSGQFSVIPPSRQSGLPEGSKFLPPKRPYRNIPMHYACQAGLDLLTSRVRLQNCGSILTFAFYLPSLRQAATSLIIQTEFHFDRFMWRCADNANRAFTCSSFTAPYFMRSMRQSVLTTSIPSDRGPVCLSDWVEITQRPVARVRSQANGGRLALEFSPALLEKTSVKGQSGR